MRSEHRTNPRSPLLLFVCTGNICRSPMAQIIATDEARRSGINVRVASAGTAAQAGNPATAYAREALSEIGLSLDAHRSQPLTRELVADADLVVAATGRHRDDLKHFFRDASYKIVSFDDVTDLGDLRDPFGDAPNEFTKVRDALRKGMPAILAAVERCKRSTDAAEGNLPPQS